MLGYFHLNGNGHSTVYRGGLQKVFFALSVIDDSGVMVSKGSQDFMETISFPGQKEDKQLGIIFNCFADLATPKNQIDSQHIERC
jgi:hypothetical protein